MSLLLTLMMGVDIILFFSFFYPPPPMSCQHGAIPSRKHLPIDGQELLRSGKDSRLVLKISVTQRMAKFTKRKHKQNLYTC